MVDYKEATVLSTTDEKITLMQWLQKLTKTFGNAVITDMSLSNDGDKSLTFTFTLADGSTKTATATAITMTEDEKALIGELVKTVSASSDGVTFNKAVTIVGNVSYQGNGIHQGTESFLGETSFTKAPTCKTAATEANQFITKSYVDEANEKCYQALKTVTKDFTRTDPVYVRIGEDGEPEIFCNLTGVTNANKYFALSFGANVTLRVTWSGVINAAGMFSYISGVKRLTVNGKTTGQLKDFIAYCPSLQYADGSLTVEGAGSLQGVLFNSPKLKTMPEIDASKATTLIYAFCMLFSLEEVKLIGPKVSFDISETAVKHDAILEVFNNLGSGVAEGTTLTLGSAKLALMSDEEKAIATAKGWTLA